MKKLLFSIAVISSLQSVVSQTFGDGILNYSVTSSSTVIVTGGAGGVCPTGALTIPDTVDYNSTTHTVTAIEENAFKQCSSLTSVIFPSSLTSIGAHAFDNCVGLDGELTLPSTLTSIGDWAFSNCLGFTGSLTLPSTLTSIGEYAFLACSGFTGSFTLPSSLTFLGQSSFYECTGFTGSLTFPSTLTLIGDYAFYNCIGLDGELTLPSTLTSIGTGAFWNCTGFTGSLTIPSSLTSISAYTFLGCSGFTGSITLPSTLTSIGDYAFSNCTGLSSVKAYMTTPPVINYNVFDGVYTNSDLLVPDGSFTTYSAAIGWQDFNNIFTLSIKDIALTKSLILYPNPANNNITVTLKSSTSYTLVSILGQEIQKGTFTIGDNTIDISHLSKGLYLLNVKTSQGTATKKIIKQ